MNRRFSHVLFAFLGVLLFDEIEKAHPQIWDLFLQMLDAARITLANHRTYDLSGFNLVATSNIGSPQLLRPTRLPFATLERAVLSELHRVFRPELIGRFDEKLVFKPLSLDTQREIGRLVVSEELARFRAQGITLTISEASLDFLVRHGVNKTVGARTMKRTVGKFIGDAVKDAFMSRQTLTGILVPNQTLSRLNLQADTRIRFSSCGLPSEEYSLEGVSLNGRSLDA